MPGVHESYLWLLYICVAYSGSLYLLGAIAIACDLVKAWRERNLAGVVVWSLGFLCSCTVGVCNSIVSWYILRYYL